MSDISPEVIIKSIPRVSETISELSTFFYQSRSQEITSVNPKYATQLSSVRDSVITQGVAFQHTVTTAVTEAEGGQLLARRIIYLLEKMKARPSMDIVEDLLEELHDLIDSQLKSVREVKTGFEGIRQGLLTIARQAQSIQGQIADDQTLALKEAGNSRRNQGLASAAAFLTAWTVVGGLVFGTVAVDQLLHKRTAVRQGRDAAEASQLLNGLCSGISSVIQILTKHVDFWSDLNVLIASQLANMTRDALIRDRDGTRTVKIGIVGRGLEDWRSIEKIYKQYASNARLSTQVYNA